MGRRAMGRRLKMKRSPAVRKGNREKQSVSAPAPASMPDLPENVICDILSRIPVEDLLRFRCVAKGWCALIDSPMFIKLQLNQALENRTNLSVIFSSDQLNSLDLHVLEDYMNGRVGHLDFVKVDQFLKFEDYWTSVEGSCNGLICLHGYIDGNETIALLNPSTKDYGILHFLPYGCGNENLIFYTFHGIVYDAVGDDYKLVRIAQRNSHPLYSEVMVYSLRSKMWRRGCDKSFNYCLYLPGKSGRISGVLVNGALHWLACPGLFDLFDIVVAFDPVIEQHWEVRVPSVSSADYGTLGVLGDCLCILYATNEEVPAELWVMNDYMVEKSWTKLFRIKLFRITDPILECFENYRGLANARVLGYSASSREVILLQMFDKLISYDLKKRRVKFSGLRSLAACLNVKSLVKLNHYQ